MVVGEEQQPVAAADVGARLFKRRNLPGEAVRSMPVVVVPMDDDVAEGELA
jgi:hypothetical protein